MKDETPERILRIIWGIAAISLSLVVLFYVYLLFA